VQSRDPARTDLATEAVTESQIFGALIGTDHRAVRLLAADLGAGGMISPAGSAGKAPQMGWLIRSGVRFANRARQTLSAWPISRGTEGSNPASSSGESGATSLTGRIPDHLSCRALGGETLVRCRSSTRRSRTSLITPAARDSALRKCNAWAKQGPTLRDYRCELPGGKRPFGPDPMRV
jgi:hypothetical protein